MSINTSKAFLSTFLSASLLACSSSDSSNDVPSNDPIGTVSPSSNIVTPTATAQFTPTTEGLIGPLGGSGLDGEYAQFNDSPFANISFGDGYFYLEDFEDRLLEHPGAEASHGNFVSLEFGENFHDSVDADDGIIDGNSLQGESWFAKVSSTGIVWSFDESQLNGLLPTHIGIVWTDGKNETRFEAFDAAGNSLGSINADHDNESFNGETNEDRFYGVVHYAGVSSIKISNDYRPTGIEVDHLQWGHLPEELR